MSQGYADRGRPSTTTRSSAPIRPPPEYYETTFFDDPDAIARLQLQRLKERAWHAYRVPFFRRRWDEAGFHPSALEQLEDLDKAPAYTVDDIRRSIEEHPPVGGLPGRHPRPTPCASRCGCSCRGGRRATRARPSTRSGTARWERVLLARQLYQQGVRPGDVVLNSWAYGTAQRRLHLRRGPAPVAQLRRAHHLDGERHLQRTPGGAGHRLRGRRHPDHRRLPAPAGRRGPADGLRPAHRLRAAGHPQHRRPRRFWRRPSGSSTSTPTGSTRCRPWPSSARPTTGCTSSRTPTSSRSSIPRPGEPAARRPAGVAVRHRAVQDREPAVPLQHHGPARRCTRPGGARAGAGCGGWRRSPAGATTWSSCGGSTSGPRPWATSPLGVAGATTDYFVRAVRRDNRDELILSVVSDGDARRSSQPSPPSRRGAAARTASGCASRSEVVPPAVARRLDRASERARPSCERVPRRPHGRAP